MHPLPMAEFGPGPSTRGRSAPERKPEQERPVRPLTVWPPKPERTPRQRGVGPASTQSVLSARTFEVFLERERSLADRGARRFSLLELRQRSGEPEGRPSGSALEELAGSLRRRLRSTDLVARADARRVEILLTDTEPAGAHSVALWVRQAAARLGLELELTTYVYPCAAEPGAPREPALELGPSQPAPVVDLWPLLEIPTPLWKRGLDVAVSASALLCLLPLFALIAVAIRLDSPGPVIFRQQRAGRGGRAFAFYKFRSMTADAEARRAELAALNEQDGPVFKIRADPRITRVGRWLRRSSIDELPQLWNVLKGDISLVGPRSPTLDEVSQYEPWQRRRLCVTGGITCTWQVSGRSQIPFREWMRLDLRYVACRNLWLDLRLLARTLPAVISGRGAS